MGLRSTLKKQALGLSQQALEKLFADEKRAGQLAQALGAVQRGKAALDTTQKVVLNQLSFATRSDFKQVGKQLGSLKKRIRALDEKLGKLT
jgi:hypothetical protein